MNTNTACQYKLTPLEPYVMFGCWGKEGEKSKGRESNLIIMFIKEGGGEVWRGLKYFQSLIFNSPKLERFGGRVEHKNA